MKIHIALANAGGGYIFDWKSEDDMKIYLAGAGTGNNNYLWKENASTPDKVMQLFLAGTYSRPYAVESIEDKKIFVLESFYYMKDWMIPYIRNHWDFLLDSGAFTFMRDPNNQNGVDWDEYLERYAAFINEHDIKHFFELDIDAVVGIAEVERMRKKLEFMTGKQSIPVWHRSRGKEYWFKMCDEYDYVALGGMASNVTYKDKVEAVFPWFLKEAAKRGTRVHALGYTSIEGLKKYRFYSVDSTAWLYGNRGGFLYEFNGRDLTKIDKPEGKRLKSRAVAIHNFREWVKFQRFALHNY
jgi:hypothetical protein